MDNQQRVEEAIKRRYFRKVIAYPDGAIVHHANCRIYSFGICTCGLMHDLKEYSTPSLLYPSYLKDVGIQFKVENFLECREDNESKRQKNAE